MRGRVRKPTEAADALTDGGTGGSRMRAGTFRATRLLPLLELLGWEAG